MSIDVRVPTTGNAGEDAVVLDWSVQVGSKVNAGDLLVTLETAKSTLEVEAPADGEILKILFDSGDEVPEHEVLAILGQEGESLSDSDPASSADEMAATASSLPDPVVAEKHHETNGHVAAHGVSLRRKYKASPRAAILAQRNGIDLSGVLGTGPLGRILIADVLSARKELFLAADHPVSPSADHQTAPTPGQPVATSTPVATPAPPSGANDFTLVPVRGARKITAQRMHDSLQQSAQVTLTRYADATALLAYIARLRTVTQAQGLPKIGVNDAVLFATARAVAKHPAANSTFDWDGIRQFNTVNLGFAVDTGQALLVPVIGNANRLSLAELAAAAKSSIDKARSGKLSTPEMEGGTFTVSNLGSLGIHWFTPVLNPPQSCILGVGAAHSAHPEAPALLPLSLTFDHRALDGAAAAGVLAEIAKCIETIDVLPALN